MSGGGGEGGRGAGDGVDDRADQCGPAAGRRDGNRWRLGRLERAREAEPGLAIYFVPANLYYANATRFTEEVLAILEEADPKVEWFCLSAASMGDIDYSGAGALRQVASEVKKHGATFVLCEVEPGVADVPAKYGLAPEIAGVYPFIEDVIEAYGARSTAS